MKKVFLLLSVLLLLMAQTAQAISFTNHRYDAFNTLQINANSIVFMGNSITNSHEWIEAFGNDPRIICRGVGSAKTSDVLDHIENVIMGHPAKFFLMIGVNDIFQNQPIEAAFANTKKVVERFLLESPQTEIYIESVLPTCGNHIDKNAKINALNAFYANYVKQLNNPKVHYIDVNSKMTRNGILNSKLTADYCHLHPNGYQIWCNAVEDQVGLKTIYQDPNVLIEPFTLSGYSGTYLMRVNMFKVLPYKSDNVMIIGDSYIESGEWQEFFHTNKVINRGNGMSYDDLTYDQLKTVVPYIFHNGAPAQVWLCVGNKMANNSLSEADFTTSLNNLIAEIRKYTSNSQRIVLGSFLPSATAATNTNYITKYNTVMANLAKSDSYIDYVDLYTPLVNNGVCNTKFFTDGRLAALGYATMARTMASKIKEAIPAAYVNTEAESEAIYQKYNQRRTLANALENNKNFSVGSATGQYPASVADAVNNALNAGWNLLKTDASVAEMQTAKQNLDNAINSAKSSIIRPQASTSGNEHWYTIHTPLRADYYSTGAANGGSLSGYTGVITNAQMWKFVKRQDGTYNIINRQYGTYVVPTTTIGKALTMSTSEPASGWTIDYAATLGLFTIYSGTTAQWNQTTADNLPVYNWFGNGGCPNRADVGCQFAISECATSSSLTAYDNLKTLTATVAGTDYTTYLIGNDPGFYSLNAYQNLSVALKNAKEALTQNLTASEYTLLYNTLNTAKNNFKMNDITDGYYYIVCGDDRFMSSQGVEKAMFMTPAGILKYADFRQGEQKELFYIKKTGNGTYSIQDMFLSKKYIDKYNSSSTAVIGATTHTTQQQITYFNNAQWSITNATDAKAYHCNGHSSGAGKTGNIITWQNDARDFGRWYLRRVNMDKISAMNTAILNAQTAYNAAFSRSASTTGLITKASDTGSDSQIWTNLNNTTYGSLSRLIDGKTDTWYLSDISQTTDKGIPYLGVDMLTARSEFKFKYSTISNTDRGWDPTDIRIYASNNKTNGPWVEVKHLNSGLPTTSASATYNSDIIAMPEAYRYLRFDFCSTKENAKDGKINVQFVIPQVAVSELQVYAVTTNENASPYYTNQNVKNAADELEALTAKSFRLIRENEVTQEDIDALNTAAYKVSTMISGEENWPEVGKYYVFESAYSIFTNAGKHKCIYTTGNELAWKEFDENDYAFYFKAEAINGNEVQFQLFWDETYPLPGTAQSTSVATQQNVNTMKLVAIGNNKFALQATGSAYFFNPSGHTVNSVAGTSGPIVSWGSAISASNEWIMRKVEDPTAAPITYKLIENKKELWSKTVHGKVNVSFPKVNVNPFIEIEAYPEGNVTEAETYELPWHSKYRYANTPDKISKWYKMDIRGAKYLNGDNSVINAVTTEGSTDSYKWGFVTENPCVSFKIYNKGQQKYAIKTEGNGQQVTLATTSDDFNILAGHSSISNSFAFKKIDDDCAWNEQNGLIKGWTGLDAGSSIRIYDADVAETISQTLSSTYGTIILPFYAAVPEGLKAYTCTGVDGTKLTLNEAELAAGRLKPFTAYIVEQTSTPASKKEFSYKGYPFTIYASTETTDLLTGTYVERVKGTNPVPADSYILLTKNNKQGFYKIVEGDEPKVPAYRCYLTVTSSETKAFFFDDETGINDSLSPTLSSREGEIFNLSGQRMNKLQKGINIVNGRKVLY